MLTSGMKPSFTHDCEKCVYIGTTIGSNLQDWYFCRGCDGGTLIARYGSDGPDYWSSPVCMIQSPRSSYQDKVVLSEQRILAQYILTLIPEEFL
jgi:hypothetical protein